MKKILYVGDFSLGLESFEDWENGFDRDKMGKDHPPILIDGPDGHMALLDFEEDQTIIFTRVISDNLSDPDYKASNTYYQVSVVPGLLRNVDEINNFDYKGAQLSISWGDYFEEEKTILGIKNLYFYYYVEIESDLERIGFLL